MNQKKGRAVGAALAAALVWACTVPVAAQTAQWKWRDRSGHFQYSDLPPPSGTPDADILQRPAASARRAGIVVPPLSAASAAPAGGVDLEFEARRRRAEQDALDRQKAIDTASAASAASARADNCRRAQGEMRTLDSGMRISRVRRDGEREYLDDAARAAEVQRTRAVVASECG